MSKICSRLVTTQLGQERFILAISCKLLTIMIYWLVKDIISIRVLFIKKVGSEKKARMLPKLYFLALLLQEWLN